VTCPQTDADRSGRIVAVCPVGNEDMAAWLVEGLVLAYRRYSADYVDEEAGRGMWAGEFIAPWEWRMTHSR
jgi:endonuclease YncB( thermonuclease family)